ncbi:MAG TPA: phospholipase D-like domain-containing protein [Xanthomonadaceae bacterium]|nr:phospholipase D-like domain-containing protein [Xanthomonadaceae bacterium]
MTHVVLHTEGDALYAAMLEDIGAAQHTLRLETYIFACDEIGSRFVDALIERAKAGVCVYFRVDAAGSFGLIPRSVARRLRDAGVRFRRWRRWSWRQPFTIHRRNHRKLLVVDRRCVYLGGFNIHRESSHEHYGEDRWMDLHVRLTGPVVGDAALLFDHDGRMPTRWRSRARRGCFLIPSRTRRSRALLHRVFHRAFARARHRVWLTTPYFVPDSRTQRELCRAASRGVDVRLLVPGKSDIRITQWAGRAAYSRLLSAGVRIFEYRPRVLHAKTALIDSDWSTVGTANLDYRSFFINDEVNAVFEDAAVNTVLAARFLADLDQSREVRLRPWRRRRWFNWFPETIGYMARRWL